MVYRDKLTDSRRYGVVGMISFAVSGVETWWWLPVLVPALISTITSIGGLSGAFLLLPFQMSLLDFTSPAVTPTNLLFNVIAIPSGVYSYMRQGRMVWPITWAVVLGTLPGVIGGVFIRILLFPDPRHFKLFVAIVLAYVGYRLVAQVLRGGTEKSDKHGTFRVSGEYLKLTELGFSFEGKGYRIKTLPILLLSFIVGLIGGTYGIGGGAIIAPFLVTIFGLPIYVVAGASLMGTFLTSIIGVLFYAFLAPVFVPMTLPVQPDWMLGLMFGVGGAIGMYTGARLQKWIPATIIKLLLALMIGAVVPKYSIEWFQA